MATSPYATVVPLARPVPSHITNLDDQARIRAYVTYEDIWNNVPEAFAALLRADDDPLTRRYIPLVRDVIEAVNRYLAVDMQTDWQVVPGNNVSDDQMDEWNGRLNAFWAREEIDIKMLSSKRWSLIKGDSLLHISANSAKAEGARVSITEIEPDQFFPIWDPSDAERMLGCYLASVVQDDAGEDVVQRIEYHRVLSAEQSAEFGAPIGSVFYRLGFFELDGWDGRDPEVDLAPVAPPSWAVANEGAADPLAGFPLDARITSLPVYHFRNRRRGGKSGRYGTSEIQGLETVYAGVIQNTSDADLAVAMVGLGVYYTTSGKARDSEGNEIPWTVGPASIAELETDGTFGRVPGITTIQPLIDQISQLEKGARGASASPLIASGSVDASSAASGVALRIQFMPTLAANAEREADLGSKWTQMLFDLMTMWFPVYEGWQALPLQPSIVFGDPLPQDREAVINEVTSLVTAGIMSKEFAATYLDKKLGFGFPIGMVEDASAEQQAALDAEGARIAAEAGQVATGGDSAA